MLLDHLLRQLIMAVQQAPPGVVTRFGSRARRVDYVREQYRRQNAFEFGRGTLARAGREFLDVAEQRFDVAIPESVTGDGIFDIFGVGNSLRQLTPPFDRNICVVLAMEHERRDPHAGEYRSDSISAFIWITALTAP